MDEISHNNDYADLLRELNAKGAEYLVVGAHAVGFHGYIRSSGDFGVWGNPTLENARKIYRALVRFGAPMDATREEEFTSDDLIFQIGVEPFRIDIITAVSGLTFEDAWAHREPTTYMGEPNFVLGLRDLLENKKRSSRPKDLLDVQQLRRINPSAREMQ
jgi:hypothetical protein